MTKFIKTFVAVFLIAVLAYIPISYGINKIGEVRLFAGTANLMNDMDQLVGESGPFWDQFPDSERVNILVMGVNSKMTDTIMLVSYDLKNQRVDVISVPRDTYFERPGYNSPGQRKINAIYAAEGIVPMAEAVSSVLMGIPINNYVIVEYEDVSKIVDAMGGVPMNIREGGMYYNDPYDNPPLVISIPQGEQVLDGAHAIQFLRFRHGYANGDIGRVAAQQEFIKSAFKQALGFSLPKVAKTTMENVESDLDLKTALKIAGKAVGLKSEDMRTCMVEGESGTRNGASYWFSDDAMVETMLTDIYSEPPKE